MVQLLAGHDLNQDQSKYLDEISTHIEAYEDGQDFDFLKEPVAKEVKKKLGPEETLKALRWKENKKHVWLKPLFVDESYEPVEPDTPGAKRIGITDCCLVSNPCPRHLEMQKGEDFENFS